MLKVGIPDNSQEEQTLIRWKYFPFMPEVQETERCNPERCHPVVADHSVRCAVNIDIGPFTVPIRKSILESLPFAFFYQCPLVLEL